jgi:hypothetical protein
MGLLALLACSLKTARWQIIDCKINSAVPQMTDDPTNALETVQEFIKNAPIDNQGKHIVYTTLRSVSRSGMTRWLDVHVVSDNEIVRLTYSVALALDLSYDRKHEAIKMTG